ncbi:MAG: hypothetical protein IJD79_10330 [Clostridia bacterium]|nr:hypothetical protein [Clostridia bacterium]
MKKITKIMIIILSIALALTGVVLVVSADDSAESIAYVDANGTEQTAASLSDALSGAKAGTTVTLKSNVKVSSAIKITKNLTLDLNGYDLSSSLSSAFSLNAAGLKFTVTGEGSITVDGAIYGGTADGTFEIIGTGKGISVLHTGTASEKFINVSRGTYNMKNLDIVSTRSAATTNAFFNDYTTAATENANDTYGAKWYIDAVKFNCLTSGDNAGAQSFGGLRFLSVGYNGYAKITNSTVTNTACLITIFGAAYKDVTETIIDVENCVFDAISAKNGTRSSIFVDSMSAGVVNRGTINIKDSTLKYAYNMVMHANSGATEEVGNNIRVNLVNSTTKGVGHILGQSDQGGQITNNAIIYIDATSKIVNHNAVFANDAKLYVSEGTRFSSNSQITNAGIKYPDGTTAASSETYAIVYDPVGDPGAPYVVVKKGDKEDNTDFWHFWNFENSNIHLTDTATDGSYIVQYQVGGNLTSSNATVKANIAYYTSKLGTGMLFEGEGEFYNFNGAAAEYLTVDNTAMKYWIPAATVGGVAYANGSKLNIAGTNASTGKTNAGPNFGLYEYTRNDCKAKLGNNAFKVAICEMDIATDSEYGFTNGTLKISSRNASNGGVIPTSSTLSLESNGTLNIAGLSGRATDTVQLDMDGWNRITAVLYAEHAIGGYGRIYYYLNGEKLGYCTISTVASTDDEAMAYYAQGLRFDVSTSQTVGTSILFDNISYRVFTEYKTEESAASLNPDYYVENYSMKENYSFTRNVITVAGKPYETVSEAITKAEAAGIYAELNGDLTVEQLVKANGYLVTNGYDIKVAEGSYSYVTTTDKNGNTIYCFDERFGVELTYHWQVGDILSGTYEDVTTVVQVGAYPTHAFNEEKWVYNETEHKIYRQTGWSGADIANPLSYEYALEVLAGETAGHVYATPIVEVFEMAQVLLDSNGKLIAATEKTDIASGSPLYSLSKGQTYKLYKDCTMSRALNSSNKTFTNGTFGIDLNGHTIRIEHYAVSFIISTNCTLNIYSSAPGGAIYKCGEADGSTVRGNALIHMAPITDANAKIESNVTGNVHNSILNVGKIDGIEGAVSSNLTLIGDCVIEPRTGDESCSVNIDGATLVRVGSAYGALIYPRFYNGSINVKNSTLINTKNNYIISTPSSAVIPVSFDYTTTAVIEGCTMIQTTVNDAIIGATENYESITVKDCVISGQLYANNSNVDSSKIQVMENVAITTRPIGYSQSVWAKYNGDFASDEITSLFGENGYYITKRITVVNSALSEKDVYIVVKGADTSAIPNNAEILELQPLKYMTLANQATVNVTWNDLDGNALVTEKYIKGGNVFDAGVSVPDSENGLVATKKIFESWGALPTSLSEDVEIDPEFTVKERISGLKYNLSLYADFGINLFIPAVYKDYVKVYKDEGKAEELSLIEVTLGESPYVKADLSQLCNKASESVSFYLSIEEVCGEDTYTAERTVSVSITEYADTILRNDNYTNADKVLVYSMLNYANEAAKYFNGIENDAVIARLLEYYKPVSVMYTTNSNYNALNEGLTDVFDTVAIRLKSSPIFVLNLHEGFRGTVTVTYAGGKEARMLSNFADVATTADNRTLVVEGMKVYNFGTILNISAEGTLNGEAISVKGRFNLDSYVQYAKDNALSHLDLVNALRAFAEISEKYKNDTLAAEVRDYGKLVISAPTTIFANYSAWNLGISFTKPEYEEDIMYKVSDDRVKIENGSIYAVGEFTDDTEVVVVAATTKHRAEFTVNVRAFTPQYSESLINGGYNTYEAEGGTIDKAKETPGCTVFVGDSYFTEYHWKDFYTDFADEDAYLLGIGGSTVDDWFECSERLLFILNPSEIIVHLGFNDTYNEGRCYATPEALGEMIVELLHIYHEKFPDANVYYCSIETSLYVPDKVFDDAIVTNSIVSAFADECDWLTFINTRPILCDDDTQTIYTEKYGEGSHPAVATYDEYKKVIDAARGKTAEE